MEKKEIKLSNRLIGEDHDPLVIAEIGINHGGQLKVALEMVDAAEKAGAEVIKHQTHIVEDEMSNDAKSIVPGNANVSIFEIMQECSLSEEEELELKNYINSKGMIFLSTPFSRAAFYRLEKFSVPGYKIGSGECNNFPLLELVAETKKPVIVSTGMNDFKTIDKVSEIFEKSGSEYAFLHTTNLYPTPHSLVRLGAMQQIKDRYDVPVGLSDHTTDNLACFGAVALGASILERHFTDSMDRPGPDIVCSMDPKALKELIHGSKILKQERGGSKNILKEEQVTIDFAYSTVVSIKDIKEGELLSEDNLWVKRPGTGDISAERYKSLLGKKAAKDISSDTHLKEDDYL